MTKRGWTTVHRYPDGPALVSAGYDLALVETQWDDQDVWKISAHLGNPLSPPRWTAALTRNTPAEIVVETLTHLTDLRDRDPYAALEGPHDVRDVFTAAERAGWSRDYLPGWATAHSPDHGPELIEIWHYVVDAWTPPSDTGLSATGINVGGHPFRNADADIWRAQFSRRTPAHLVTAVLKAAVSTKPASRRPDEIPDLYREAVTTAEPLPTHGPAPSGASSALDDPTAATAPVRDHWSFVEDQVDNLDFRSPCGRVRFLDTPEDLDDPTWTSRWRITAQGDDRSFADNEPPLSWTATFTTHTPPTVVAAVLKTVDGAIRDLDIEEVMEDFESSPEPSFSPHRAYRPDPVPGSRDPDLAHARLRLHGWDKADRSRTKASRSPSGVELRSVARADPSSLDSLPAAESWTLDGGVPPASWSARFSHDTPTALVIAAAWEAERLALPAQDGAAPQLGRTARQVAARSAPAHRPPSVSATPDASRVPPAEGGRQRSR
ncbi:DUF317 domain-containing protein [Kitasatospora sp. NPDC098663]|uniref:DUF317 domain-containing protein n=1 Tax=Kitasatospora sp. NPDC098663 TaxID=3364096 RepID=UPI003812791E